MRRPPETALRVSVSVWCLRLGALCLRYYMVSCDGLIVLSYPVIYLFQRKGKKRKKSIIRLTEVPRTRTRQMKLHGQKFKVPKQQSFSNFPINVPESPTQKQTRRLSRKTAQLREDHSGVDGPMGRPASLESRSRGPW